MPPTVHHDIDMRDVSWHRAIIDAFETLFVRSDNDVMRVVGPAPMGGDFVEIVHRRGAAAAGDAALLASTSCCCR